MKARRRAGFASHGLGMLLVFAVLTPGRAAGQDTLTVVKGTPPTEVASPDRFTGTVRVGNGFRGKAPASVFGATVAFEAGARTHWHVHPLGQTLVVTSGTGRVQVQGGPVREVRTGDVVVFPPGAKHWHGAAPTTAMTHVAIVEMPESGSSTSWMEAVSEAEYRGAPGNDVGTGQAESPPGSILEHSDR